MLQETPDRTGALAQYGKIAHYYDWQVFFRGVRRKGVASLGLRPGQTALEAGCGTGINLVTMRSYVGDDGKVIGIDQSPLMLAQARAKVARHGWTNVETIASPLEQAELPEQADALLFSYTHDIFRIQSAVDSALAKVKPGGRVVAICTRWDERTAPRYATGVIKLLSRRYMTTFEGIDEPWSNITRHLDDVTFRDYIFGTNVVVAGTKRLE